MEKCDKILHGNGLKVLIYIVASISRLSNGEKGSRTKDRAFARPYGYGCAAWGQVFFGGGMSFGIRE